jgi:hypothetical protein
MVELLAPWCLLGIMSLVIGDAAFSLLGCRGEARRGDRLVLSLWLGLVLCQWLALTLSLISPVSPVRFFLLVGIVFAFCAARRGRDIASELCGLRRSDLVAAVLVMSAASFVVAGMRPTPDIGEYHYPAIRWLAEYGSVRGVSHILFRLGAASGVFALTAPFDELLPGRSLGLINGFILCLTVGQIILSGVRVTGGRGRPSDWFLLAGSAGLLAIGLLVGSFTTTAPELGVAALTLVIAWRMLAQEAEPQDGRSPVLLVLAAGALLAKLSALLLVPVVALFVLAGRGLRAWLGVALLVAILVAPVFLASALASGCLAINVALSCLPLPWAVPTDIVNQFSHYLLQWSRAAAALPPDAGAWDWIPLWLSQWFNLVVLGPFVASLIAYGFVTGRNIGRGECWVFALILPSLVLMLVSAPDPRFNYGLFIVPVALLAARLGPRLLIRCPTWVISGLSNPASLAALLAAPLVLTATAVDLHHGYALGLGRLLEPRRPPAVAVTPYADNGLTYVVPKGGHGCWGAPLPCADRELQDVHLLSPERGLAGGFYSRH